MGLDRNAITLGSLFDGIGGWCLAAVHAGVQPIWSSEIERFPQEVTKRRFPTVVQLGDITKIDAKKIESVDIICAGSPCQDLSIAGKREGLKGERSGLFRKAVEIVRQMQVQTGGKFPRFFVWENVLGAFSSNKGLDFRTVLEEIGQTEIPMPDGGKWATAGLVQCDKCEIAWRVLDAQYWGVPQRRKRIFLIADFAKTGRGAGEILFEPQGVPRDIAESNKEKQGTPSGVKNSIDKAGRNVVYSFDSLSSNSMKSKNPHNGCRQVDIARTLDTSIPDPSKNQGGIAIFDMTHADNPVASYNHNVCHTLTHRMGTGGNQVPVLSYAIAGNTANRQAAAVMRESHGEYGCLHSGSENYVMNKTTYLTSKSDYHTVVSKNLAHTLVSTDYKDPQTVTVLNEKNTTVRRLAPLECERLQGLPDNWTLINDKSCSDSARYKAIGNGMAQPCADWILKRIMEVAYKEAIK